MDVNRKTEAKQESNTKTHRSLSTRSTFNSDDAGTSPHHQNLYSILGVELYTATPESIRRSYRKLARLCHPDRHKGNEKAKQQFQAVQGAYEVLSDTWKRQEYDLWLLEYLDVVDYLEVFKGFTLTVCGLGMDSKRLYPDFESDVSMGPAGVFSS
ncbi:DnaJ domain-containing protein [Dunaliella salina]|uniref:DnaJ domain-containing protein n=1 Tax=Dunaliella salina TaxID=3046 RepID=A0ABQ7G9I1_DUNSA|nr:DnaJ domain-containing protein [Dunaliella salina]|eukprot:KAF5831220.1 DnaJ domain-containing protein [Dunaliella salina]